MGAENSGCSRVQNCWLCPTSVKLKFFDKLRWKWPVLNFWNRFH